MKKKHKCQIKGIWLNDPIQLINMLRPIVGSNKRSIEKINTRYIFFEIKTPNQTKEKKGDYGLSIFLHIKMLIKRWIKKIIKWGTS